MRLDVDLNGRLFQTCPLLILEGDCPRLDSPRFPIPAVSGAVLACPRDDGHLTPLGVAHVRDERLRGHRPDGSVTSARPSARGRPRPGDPARSRAEAGGAGLLDK